MEFDDLLEAVRLTPENPPLFTLFLKAGLKDPQWEKALPFLENPPPSYQSHSEIPLLMAHYFLKTDQKEKWEKGLALIEKLEDARSSLLKSKFYSEMEQWEKARKYYQLAIDENRTLEDFNLLQKIESKVGTQTARRGNLIPLRVVANDDTDQEEISRLLHPQERQVAFKDVGGLVDIKETIHKKIILPFQKPGLFEKFKKKVGGGILFYGPPGCGKTLLARATAGECQAQFFNVLISDILDMYIGESERKLHALFDKSRHKTPSVLFFDELEALAGKRQFTREATSSKLVSQFLSEMDGFEKNNQGVLILGATNVPWAIDPAFRRPGRFDRVVFIPPPDKIARKSILEILTKTLPQETGQQKIDFDFVASKTSGYSGADLQNLIETASDHAIQDSLSQGEEQNLNSNHFLKALKEVKSTTGEWLTTARNYARYSNESGQYDEVLHFLEKSAKN